MINKPIIYTFFKDFTNHGKRTDEIVFSSQAPLPNSLKHKDHKDVPIIWKIRFIQTHLEKIG